MASSAVQEPFASRRILASSPSASRTASACSTSSEPPTFSLNVEKPSSAQRLGGPRHRARGRRRRGSRCTATGLGAAGGSPERVSTARERARPAADSRRLPQARRRRARVDELHDTARSSATIASSARPPRSDIEVVSPCPMTPSASVSRSRISSRCCEPAARGHVRLAEGQRVRDDLGGADHEQSVKGPGPPLGCQQQAEREQQAEGAEQRAGLGQGLVQRGAVGAGAHAPDRRDRERQGEKREQAERRAAGGGEADREHHVGAERERA